ncbi:D-alanyl-D-alanine carboxypeptidase [Lactobacillus pentosus] [Lactiplantibacillus mudanjiangensis]|uniref:D-alanyl-D-alanine carboxypeptidase family protein n=1 Tax=Lactiplantibacillus mudanjiangensis TaxID=1296538 RepID=UPI001015166F|nr:D-alanyl-D-alanine carboxypeptidase [Lactobacillus pentosus] [Lactiplantibacillus mudanjiangensis]
MLKWRTPMVVRWLSLIVVLWSGLVMGTTTGQAKTSKANQVKAAYIMDTKSGQAVYAQNADEALPIASLSKLMTLYLVEEAIDHGQIKWTDIVPIQSNVQKMATSSTLSTMPMPKKTKFTVRELLAATLVGSSNSSAIALGEYVAGSNPKFIAKMNAQANQWGINAHFVSASGLDNTDLTTYDLNLKGTSATAQNLVSAKAITTVAQHLVNKYPSVLKVSNQRSVKIHGYKVPTSVLVLKGESYYDARVPVDGLKTGYTDQAGGCLVATFTLHGRRMIATTLGSKWKFTANNNLRLQLKQQGRYQQVAPTTIQYDVPGTQTTLRLVAQGHTNAWTYTDQTVTTTKQVVIKVLKSRPNYLAARTPVMQLKLTNTSAGTTTTITYVTPTATVIGGPMQLATKPIVKQSLSLNAAFAFAN